MSTYRSGYEPLPLPPVADVFIGGQMHHSWCPRTTGNPMCLCGTDPASIPTVEETQRRIEKERKTP